LPTPMTERASFNGGRMRGKPVFGDITGKALVAACFLAWSNIHAQQSPSYTLRESQFNAGGTPGSGAPATPSSSSYRITLDALGEGLLGPTPASASFRVDGGFARTY